MRSRSTRFPFHNHKVANRIGACTPIDVFEENVGNGRAATYHPGQPPARGPHRLPGDHVRPHRPRRAERVVGLRRSPRHRHVQRPLRPPSTSVRTGRRQLEHAPGLWPTGFIPYGHQGAAFERLSTKFHNRPQPTLVTTGTGSGKTEAFLYPILEHVLRSKAAGVTG